MAIEPKRDRRPFFEEGLFWSLSRKGTGGPFGAKVEKGPAARLFKTTEKLPLAF